MGRFVWVVGVILLLGTLGGAWYINRNGGPFHPAPKNDQADASLPNKIICIGFVNIEPGVIKMYPLQLGLIKEVVAEGKDVKKDEVLLKVDSSLAQIKVEQAQADLNNALELAVQAKLRPTQHEYQIEQLAAKIASAQRLFKAAEEEFEQGKKNALTIGKSFNLKPLEEKFKGMEEEVKSVKAKMKELKLDDPQIDIRRAAAAVLGKTAQLAEANWALTQCTLKAPADGTVLQVFVNANEVLGPHPTQPALIFAPKVPRIVQAEVIQEWASRVEVGQDAIVEDDTFRGPQWQGKVKQIALIYSPKTPIREPFMMLDQRILQCIIEINPGQSPPLRIGQRVRVSILPTAN